MRFYVETLLLIKLELPFLFSQGAIDTKFSNKACEIHKICCPSPRRRHYRRRHRLRTRRLRLRITRTGQ